ncbi:MAG: adenine deaminase [Bacteroidota bacterium]
MSSKFQLSGNLVNVFTKEIYFGTLEIQDGKIFSHKKSGPENSSFPYYLPGFIDSHVHIESSMLVPSEFARLAVVHGTVATISDPHEIANVCGIEGVEYMIENGKTVPFKFNFGAPSCVPATVFETAGDTLDAEAVKQLLQRPEIKYLSEMMNFPGVLHGDEEVLKKIEAARALGKPIDGHAPGLRGEAAKKYIETPLAKEEGDVIISTDHECFTKEEALDKIGYGMKIIIREGSAAKNFEALIDLLHDYPDQILFCSDDKHPDSLILGHINQLCARAVEKGINIFNVLQAACVNPVTHYKLGVGLLREGDDADFVCVNNLREFKVSETYIRGQLVAKEGVSFIQSAKPGIVNRFQCEEQDAEAFLFKKEEWIKAEDSYVPVVEVLDGQLITNRLSVPTSSFIIEDGIMQANTEKDLLYMVVVNRYNPAPVAKCFVHRFGLQKGAIASSVAHDSHNIIAVGTSADALQRAVNLVIREKGGVSAVYEEDGQWRESVVALPVAGLMSNEDGYKVAQAYSNIDAMSREMGSSLQAPYMSLSFMALLVIPHLKLSDKGLFDGDRFEFV